MAEVKVRKKDIQEAKRPDVILQNASSLFDWLLKRRTLVLSVLAGVLVLLALASGLRAHARSQDRKAGGELSRALELSTRPIDKNPTADEKAFPDEAARDKAVSDALAKVEAAHEASPTGQSAALVLGRQQVEAGKWDDAIKSEEDYLKGGKGDLQLFAYEDLGYAYEGKKDWAKAAEAFGHLADYGAPGRAEYHQARLLEEQGKKDEARKKYEDVIANHSKESVATDAKVRLDLLDLPPAGQGALQAPAAPAEAPAPAPKAAPKKHAPAKKAAAK